MTETPLRSITIAEPACSYWLLHILRRSLSVETLWQHTLFPLFVGMLLTRDSIVGFFIPSSISLLASLFTHSAIHHLITNSLVTLLASFLWCILPRGPRDTSPILGVTNPNLDSRQPNKTPLEILVEHLYNHPVTLWCLIAQKAFLRYPGVAWSHSQRNMYLTYMKAITI